MKSMDFSILIFIWVGFLLLVNMITAGLIIYCGKKNKPLFNSAGAVIIPCFIVLSLISIIFCSNKGSISDWEISFILSSTMIIMLLSYFAPQKVTLIFTLIAGAASFLFLPEGMFAFAGNLWPLAWIGAAIFWAWLIYSFRTLDEVDGLTISEGTFIGTAIFLESWFLAVMVADNYAVLGLLGAAAAICLYSFKNWNRFPAKIKLGQACVLPMSFILGWMLVRFAAEGAWLFAIIVPMLFFGETLYANIKKYIFGNKEAITFLIAKARGGAYQNLLVKAVFKGNIFLLVFASLTPKGISPWSFLILALIWTIYELNRFYHFGEPEPTITEITKGIFGEAKKGYAQQKTFYSLLGKNLKEGKGIKEAFASSNTEFDATLKSMKGQNNKEVSNQDTKSEEKQNPKAKPKSSTKVKGKTSGKSTSKTKAKSNKTASMSSSKETTAKTGTKTKRGKKAKN